VRPEYRPVRLFLTIFCCSSAGPNYCLFVAACTELDARRIFPPGTRLSFSGGRNGRLNVVVVEVGPR
jgi:hypothetical protein